MNDRPKLAMPVDLRDFFAAKAMHALLSRSNHDDLESIAMYAYLIAESMMKERAK